MQTNNSNQTKKDSIIRIPLSTGKYATINNKILSDEKLTSNAFRLLVAILNNSDEWILNTTRYLSLWGWDKSALAKATKCLIKNGYLIKWKKEADGNKGFIQPYTVSEYGNLDPALSGTKRPVPEANKQEVVEKAVQQTPEENIHIKTNDQPIKETSIENVNHITTNNQFNVVDYLTPMKIEWAKSKGLDIDILHIMTKEELDSTFYHNNVWEIRTTEKNGLLWENIHGVTLRYIGAGGRFTLFLNDNYGKEKDSFQLNDKDFAKYMEDKDITFGNITIEDFNKLKAFKKAPLSMYQV